MESVPIAPTSTTESESVTPIVDAPSSTLTDTASTPIDTPIDAPNDAKLSEGIETVSQGQVTALTVEEPSPAMVETEEVAAIATAVVVEATTGEVAPPPATETSISPEAPAPTATETTLPIEDSAIAKEEGGETEPMTTEDAVTETAVETVAEVLPSQITPGVEDETPSATLVDHVEAAMLPVVNITTTATAITADLDGILTPPAKRGRGRPRKYPKKIIDPNTPKRGRGRPRKYPRPEGDDGKPKKPVLLPNGQKRGRGRPRKHPYVEKPVLPEGTPKRGRGRPRKYPKLERDPDAPKRPRGRPRKQTLNPTLEGNTTTMASIPVSMSLPEQVPVSVPVPS